MQPISNRFYSIDKEEDIAMFPLGLSVDENTGLVKITKPFPVDELCPRYDWLTCFEPEDHLDNLVDKIVELQGIDENSVIGAYSFKDDSTLERLNKKGFNNTWRIDPEKDLGVTSKMANVETYQDAFTEKCAKSIKDKHGEADIFIVRHVVEHAYNLSSFIKAIKTLIKPDGYIVWELPDCERALLSGDCSMVWEEHIYYFTKYTFRQRMLTESFEIAYFDSVSYPLEDCIIAIVQSSNETYNSDFDANTVAIKSELEQVYGFPPKLRKIKVEVREKLELLHNKYGRIGLFGAGHLTVAFLSILDVSEYIYCVIDDNENKKGSIMPTGKLKIVSSNSLYEDSINVCLLGLNPQNHRNIILKHNEYVQQGGIFASIFPGTEKYLGEIL